MAALHQGVFLVLFLVSSPILTNNVSADHNPLATHLKRKLLPTSDCGLHEEDHVYLGQDVYPGEYPWLALIQYRKRDKLGFKCGGFLINKRYVVTTAHCLHAETLGGYIPTMVRLGEYNTTTDPDNIVHLESVADPVLDLGIEQVILHDNFSPRTVQNNIALIRLDRDVPVTHYVRPICLPSPEEDRRLTAAGKELEEVGWGMAANNARSTVPRRNRLPVVDVGDCADIYSKFKRNVTNLQVCAGDGRNKYCVGESGSPLMGYTSPGRYLALGIASFGPYRCDLTNIPNVYTRVASYLSWILDNMSP